MPTAIFVDAGFFLKRFPKVYHAVRCQWCEAEVNRTAGNRMLSPEPDPAKAEAHFARALAMAREQRAKSWELRAAMSMARLWRDQGRRPQARDFLASVQGCFTEGFSTLDLRQAKVLLDDLATADSSDVARPSDDISLTGDPVSLPGAAADVARTC